MALTADQVNQEYMRILGRPVDQSGLKTYTSGPSLDFLRKDLYGSDEFARNPRPTNSLYQAQPLTSGDLAGFTKQAQDMYAPVQQAASDRLAAFKQNSANTTASLQDRLKENAGYATGAQNEQMNNLGLLQSGSNAAGVGKINRDLSYSLNQADIQKALNDADAALQYGQTNAQTQTDISNQANNLANQAYGIRTQNAQNNQAGAQTSLAQSQALQSLFSNPFQMGNFLHSYNSDGSYSPNPAGQEALAQILRSYGLEVQ